MALAAEPGLIDAKLTVSEKHHTLISNYEMMRPLLAAYGPPELQKLRDEAMRRFSEVGLPTHKDEEFKYTPFNSVRESEYQPAYGSTVFRGDLKPSPLDGIKAVTISFVNGEFAPELAVEGALPEGVILKELREAVDENYELIAPYLSKVHTLDDKLGSTNDERFRWLNTAFIGEGAFLYIPKGVTVESLIHVQFVNRADFGLLASFPRLLIVLEEGASAKVLESHFGLSGEYFSCAVTEISLGDRANLEHIRLQHETNEATHVGTVAVRQGANSVLSSNNIQLGAKTSKVDVNVGVAGEHAETWLNGAYAGLGEQVLDNHTRIDHEVPNCNSFEVYKGILGGRATGVFNGKIFVYEDAQKTDAKQTNQAILLSPTAVVNTKPQLEIFADDVKCTHGATVGQLREDALFYLRARGIPKRQAQALLVYAFAAEVMEKISNEPLRHALEKALSDKLHEDEEFHSSGA